MVFQFLYLISKLFQSTGMFWREDTGLIFHVVGVLVMRSHHVDFLCSEFVWTVQGRGEEKMWVHLGCRSWKLLGWTERTGLETGYASCFKPEV